MNTRAILCLAALAGCAVDGSGDDADTNGKGDQGQTCEDPAYGDGVCQIGLACGIPDIDCFQTFASDAEAATWFSGMTGATPLPETDPLVVRARALTDRAWAAFVAMNHLGKLAEMHVGVVVLPDPTINAFVSGSMDSTKAVLSVQYHTAILAPDIGDEELLGVVWHELTHATKLHVLPEVYDRTLRYYVADGVEPIGAFQTDDARVRQQVETWDGLAGLAGPYARPELLDLPIGGNLGALFNWMLQMHQPSCPTEVAETTTLLGEIGAGESSADEDIALDAARSAQIHSVLDRLATCTRNSALSISQLTAGDDGWANYLHSVITTDEQWLLDEADGVTALQILAGDRREKLRALAGGFQREIGTPWAAARFYSTEEEADDMSVRITTQQSFAAPGVSLLMHRVLSNPAQCDEVLGKHAVPYGVHLEDPHHGTCWRIAHAQQVAESTGSSARREVAAMPMWTPTKPSDGKPMY
jgi:hypothetical protein